MATVASQFPQNLGLVKDSVRIQSETSYENGFTFIVGSGLSALLWMA